MRLYSLMSDGVPGVAIEGPKSSLRIMTTYDENYPGSLMDALADGRTGLDRLAKELGRGRVTDPDSVTYLPPIPRPGKVICVGLNYASHTKETGQTQTEFPTIFVRVATSLIGHDETIVVPAGSAMFDYEGEVAAIVGLPGRGIPASQALKHVAGYAVFNDCTARDFSRKTTQWTAGKNFDGTGAFGPCLVTADELPPGAAGIQIRTRLNGDVVQDANTSHMLQDTASLVAVISGLMTLEPGDVIVTGSPAGVGASKSPPRFLQAGDVCEVEVEGIGTLRNTIIEERGRAQ